MRVVVSRFSDLFSIDKFDLGRMALAEVGKNLEGEEGPISVPVAANSTSSTQKYEQRARSESDLKIWNADRSKIAGQQIEHPFLSNIIQPEAPPESLIVERIRPCPEEVPDDDHQRRRGTHSLRRRGRCKAGNSVSYVVISPSRI